MVPQRIPAARQIKSIAGLKTCIGMHNGKLVQADINELIDNLMRSVRQSHTELSKAFVSNDKVRSTITWAYESIKTQATKAGRLANAKHLLGELEKAATIYKEILRNLEAIVLDQEKIIPTLKENTQTILKLIQDGHLLELRPLINEHRIILTEIDGQLTKLKVDIINIVSDEGMSGTLTSLSDDCFKDQVMTIVNGGIMVLEGAGIGTLFGLVAIKSGLAMFTITAAPVSVAVGAMGLSAYGLHKIVQEVNNNWNDFTEASRYKTVLEEVKVKIGNFKVTLDQLHNEIRDQSNALGSTLESLDVRNDTQTGPALL